MSYEKQFVDPYFTDTFDLISCDLYLLIFARVKIPRKLKKLMVNEKHRLLLTRRYHRMSLNKYSKRYSASKESLKEFEERTSEFKKKFGIYEYSGIVYTQNSNIIKK